MQKRILKANNWLCFYCFEFVTPLSSFISHLDIFECVWKKKKVAKILVSKFFCLHGNPNKPIVLCPYFQSNMIRDKTFEIHQWNQLLQKSNAMLVTTLHKFIFLFRCPTEVYPNGSMIMESVEVCADESSRVCPRIFKNCENQCCIELMTWARKFCAFLP